MIVRFSRQRLAFSAGRVADELAVGRIEVHLAGDEEQAVGLDGVRVRPRGGRSGVRGHGFARMGHRKDAIRDAESPRLRDLPVPAPARRQPRGLVSVGRRGVRPRARGGQARAGLDRLRGLPLVPRDGARVLRGPGRRAGHEHALRVRQGRPRGAPRRRRDPHGRRPGHDRPGRVAAERVPHARGRAVPRRHLLPARAAPRDAVVARRARRRLERVDDAARRDRGGGGQPTCRGCRARASWRRPRARSRPPCWTRP